MPKFYGQNKKRIDPRYFLEETINRDDFEKIEERAPFQGGVSVEPQLQTPLSADEEERYPSADDEECWCEDADGNKVRDFVTKTPWYDWQTGPSRGCRGSEIKVCPEGVFDQEIEDIKGAREKRDKVLRRRSGVTRDGRPCWCDEPGCGGCD